MQKNVGSQKWIVFAFDRTDNTPKTGDAANITANLRIDGGAANAVDDVNPTELEDGFYIFDITQAETNGDHILISPASVTADIQVIGAPAALFTTAPNFNTLGIESDGDLTKVNTCDTNTDVRGTDNAALAATAVTSATWTDLRAGYLDNLDISENVAGTSEVSGLNDVSTVEVQSSCDAAITANTNVSDILTDTATTIPGLISALNNLTSGEVGDAVLDEVVEGAYTLRQLVRLIVSALAGKLSGAATTEISIRDLADSKDRVVATVDADGNRTALTLDAD